MNSAKVGIQFINEIASAERLPYTTAVEEARRRDPDLYKLVMACGATKQAIQFFNERHRRRLDAPGKIEARTQFHGQVHAYMAEFRVDYDTAYRRCQRTHPEFSNAMEGKGTSDNSAGGAGAGVPVKSPRHCAILMLPASIDQGTFAAAFTANGGQLWPANPGRIAEGLIDYFMSEGKGRQEATDAVKERCPELWAAVGQLASGK